MGLTQHRSLNHLGQQKQKAKQAMVWFEVLFGPILNRLGTG